MFSPNYTITSKLLANIKRLAVLVQELNQRRFSRVILMELEKSARAVSTFASTSIEGNPLPLTEVKKVLKSKPMNLRNSEQEVINYNQALVDLDKHLKTKNPQVSLKLVLSIHQQVTTGLLPDFESGKLRQKPVVVNNPRSGEVVYLPPDVNEVQKLVPMLINFIKQSQGRIDPFILAGLFHKQMVIIHPFMDGNGRTTRLVTKALLAQMGLNTFNLFSFENYYNQNVTQYFEKVGEFGDYNELADEIDFTLWLEYFTDGIIDELLRVGHLLPDFNRSPQTKLKKYHQSILKHIQKHGFIADRDYATLTDRAKATRALDFQKMINLSLIERQGKGRATYYVLKES
ncbi:MAG: Fic family protein [Candidatus Pacebacteria bacterium]|jgi:Fic family protein|nr:Fic family protein [Candidatus Paceibacterota bacterium]MBT3511625.1 Fic family protein [Candidatus Paceibacterota bacterium]MBT4004714.1 Fic family protein [Candidatus Paceibacterota bacterium]MBT4359252.1 Fic family protein [Candidatus Paceibacterota bacterium]MBT4681032.1 Fic family protein [Candidatus Paceibacterota bacterium]